MGKMQQLQHEAISVGSGAVYPYSEELLAECVRETRFGEEYTLARVIGSGHLRRILVPRHMASSAQSDLRADGSPFKFKSSFKPRNDEQSRVINEAVQLLAAGENFMMEAPTGFGKTWCAVDIIAKVGKKTLIVVTKEDIRDQWIVALETLLGLKVGKGIGMIQADTCLTSGQGVVVAMIQSLAKDSRYPEHVFREFGLGIWDECHRVAADYFMQSCFRLPAKLRMGISATPDRKDGREEVLYAHIGPVLVRTEAAPMVPRVITQKSPWEIPYRRKKLESGEYIMAPIPHTPGKCMHVVKMLANHFPRNLRIATFTSAAFKKGRTILVQSDLKDHLELLTSLIAEQGVPMGEIAYYVGGMSAKQRDHAKTKRVIMATYQMTAEATDIPWLDTLVMATPKADVRQIVGRILRTHPGKKDPVVFDMVDSTSNVFQGYWNSRHNWYASIGAEVERL